eukprot:SAG11_NODE_2876_length_2880_cov_1.317512_3_plen_214_part_00
MPVVVSRCGSKGCARARAAEASGRAARCPSAWFIGRYSSICLVTALTSPTQLHAVIALMPPHMHHSFIGFTNTLLVVIIPHPQLRRRQLPVPVRLRRLWREAARASRSSLHSFSNQYLRKPTLRQISAMRCRCPHEHKTLYPLLSLFTFHVARGVTREKTEAQAPPSKMGYSPRAVRAAFSCWTDIASTAALVMGASESTSWPSALEYSASPI